MTKWSYFRARVRAASLCLVVTAGAATFLSACSGAPSSTPSSGALPATTQLDGKTLFTGLMFGQGDVAALFPEIWQGQDQSIRNPTAQQAAAIDKLVTAVEAGHPGFLDRFAAEVQSGDHLRVQGAITEALTDITALVPTNNIGGTQGECFFVFFAGFINLAAFINGAINVNVAIDTNAFVQTNINFTQSCGSGCGSFSCGGFGCGGGCGGFAYHNAGAGAAAAPKEVDAGKSTAQPPKSTVQMDEYVDLIANRLGPSAK